MRAIDLALLVSYLDRYLRISEVADAPNALNGLQVEERFEWKQVNRNLFRLVHERSHGHGQQLNAEACHFWRGLYEAAFRWSGLEGEWLLDEVECGRVSGTQACVFTIVRNGPGR